MNKFQFFLSNKKFIAFVWFLLAFIAGLKHAIRGVFNDYLIFKSVFFHTLEQVNLYLKYPELNGDSNHYGPIFSLIFAPFALLPDSLGTILWELLMALVLFIAIYKLPLKWNFKVVIYYVCLQGVYANAVNSETNTLVAALIIATFISVRTDNDFWAGCFIVLGTFFKLYGIVGLSFFFFSKHKARFLLSIILFSIVFFILPMLISSPQFIIQSYFDWYESLVTKNLLNIDSLYQDISVMGMIRRISNHHDISNLFIIIPSILIFAFQFIRKQNYNNLNFQLAILSSSLLSVVLFSTGSEPCTYIIATVGFGIWFVIQPRPYSHYCLFLLIFVQIVIFASSGLTPQFIRVNIVKRYALEALPFFMVWLHLAYQLIFEKNINMVKSVTSDIK